MRKIESWSVDQNNFWARLIGINHFFQLFIMISGAILNFSLAQGKAIPHSSLYQIIGRHILADVLTYTYKNQDIYSNMWYFMRFLFNYQLLIYLSYLKNIWYHFYRVYKVFDLTS